MLKKISVTDWIREGRDGKSVIVCSRPAETDCKNELCNRARMAGFKEGECVRDTEDHTESRFCQCEYCNTLRERRPEKAAALVARILPGWVIDLDGDGTAAEATNSITGGQSFDRSGFTDVTGPQPEPAPVRRRSDFYDSLLETVKADDSLQSVGIDMGGTMYTSTWAARRTTVGAKLPQSSAERKRIPLATGCLDMFPRALAAIAEVSGHGMRKHGHVYMELDKHPSSEDADALLRHLADRGTLDTNGYRHSAEAAWRALAMLEHELEEALGL